MLKQPQIAKIATLLKLDPKKLEDAMKDTNEVDIDIDDKLQVFDDATLTSRDRSKYNEGKKAGEEMQVKNIKTKHGIDADGLDPDKVIDAIIAKTKKDLGEPSQREKDLEQKVEQWKTKFKDAEDKATASEKKAAEAALDNEILGYFPKDRDSKFTDAEYLTLVKKTLQIETTDGKRIVKKDGKALENDKTLEPVALKDAVEAHFTERNWKVAEGGGGADKREGPGGDNSNPGGGAKKFKKMSEVRKHLDDQGISLQGEKGNAFVQAAIKENPQMDMNS